MTRRHDLESHIRESYALIRDYEDILRTSDRPKEKARARRNIEEQWGLIAGFLKEYLALCESQGLSLPSDIQEIAARFENESTEPAPNVPESPLGDTAKTGSKYSIQIEHAEGLAIGDGAQVIQSSSPQRRKPTDAVRGDTYPHSASQEPPGPIKDRWALLVGVNRYVDPAFPPLKFCVNDVLALEATLKALGYTVVSLHDDASEEHLMPTRDNVEAELARICQIAGPDDLIWVHIATHGKLVNGKPLLITRETRAPTLTRRALRLADVEQQMRASQARRLVLTLDACHTGVEVGRDLADPEFIRNAYELAEGFALIAASTAQQVAQEWEAKEHGVFTYHLLEGLKGRADRNDKGFVTVSDLTTHTLDGLRHWNVEQGGLLQEPTARTEGLGDMILADYREQFSGSTDPIRNPMAPNPFGDVGRIVDPDRFFDREELMRQIFEELNKGANLSLVGDTQIGKSSILSMVQAHGPEQMNLPAEAFCYLSMQWVDSEEGFYEALCDTLDIQACRGYKLHRALQNENYVLCLDEIEKMSWDGFTERLRSQLRGLADGPAAPIRLVIASRSPLSVLFPDSPELDSPLAGICRTIDIRPFSPKISQSFIKSRLEGTRVDFTKSEIDTLLSESDGHPAKLQRAAANLYNKKRGT
jgi:hypothetical protein